MSIPFQNPLRDKRESRSRRYPLAVSLAIHAVLVVVMLTLPAQFARKVEKPKHIDIVFYSPDEAERQWTPPPELPEAEPEPEPAPVPIVEIEPPAPPVQAPPPVARKAAPPKPRVPKPEPPKRTVRTASFEEQTKPDSVVPTPKRTARKGSFGDTEPTRPERAPSSRTVMPAGSFETVSAGTASRPANTRVVAAGQFASGDLTVPRPARPSRGSAVTTSSFEVAAVDAPARTRPSGSVMQGGFGSEDVAASQPRQRKRPVEDLDTPVSIVSKPKPVYSEEARRLRIEGEVVLEVTFPTSGRIRVLRVVGSLGHGLDEAAIEAAKKIEFEPARRDGRPVDHTATLRVIFRLA